ncbi:hypothetical protein ACJX0J_001739 (mitochondrion) [Zea mays]
MVVEDLKTIIKECYNFWESEYKDMRNLMHLNTGLQTLDALTVIHFIDILMDEYESGNNTVPVYTVHDNFITTPLTLKPLFLLINLLTLQSICGHNLSLQATSIRVPVDHSYFGLEHFR